MVGQPPDHTRELRTTTMARGRGGDQRHDVVLLVFEYFLSVKSLTTVAPPTFPKRNHRSVSKPALSRSYLLKYGVPRHPDVINR